MYAQERQHKILDHARAEGRVEVATLATLLDVTPETVRRDLTTLERHGLLRRVHGGAIPVDRLNFEPKLAVRQGRYTGEKERIAKAALEYLPEAGTVLLDAGSSTALLADQLPADREFTVVTNSVAVAATLAARENIQLFQLGGRIRGKTMAAVGEWAVSALRGIGVDVAFVGTNGLSLSRGLTTPDQEEALIKRAQIAAAAQVVVLCDHSKIGQNHFASVARVDEIDTVITDTGLDDETADEIEAAGPVVIRA